MEGFVKLENCERNDLIQNYINNMNEEMERDDDTTTVIEVVDENMVAQDGTYYMDDEGRYYYQPGPPVQTTDDYDHDQNIEVVIPDSTSHGNQEEQVEGTQVIVEESEEYPSVRIVPSDPTSGGEVSYLLVVEQEENEGETDQAHQNANPQDADNELGVYDFDENDEDKAESVDDSDFEDDKRKIMKITTTMKKKVVMRHSCNYCDYTSPRRYLLARHMKSHSEVRPHRCSVCERGFKTYASLQNHVNTHTGVKPHICKFCKSAFTTSGELVRHVRYRHTHEKPHKCNECDYASVELSKLKRHVRCHTGERPYQCPNCTYASPDTFKLKRHLRTHTGEKPYVCDFCKMCFTQSNSLKAHKLIHNIGSKPVFSCELCPTTCGRKTDLRIHVQKLHTSDRPLKCKKCGKNFPDRYSYKLHIKTHDGEKCYKCEMCPYASISQRHLSSHMLKHTDEKPFTCGLCDQAFRQKQLLRRHENLYHNPEYVPTPPKEKSHECRECRRQFAHKGNLIRHMAIHDPDSDVRAKSLAVKLGRTKRMNYVSVPMVFEEGEEEDDQEQEEEVEEEPYVEVIEEDEVVLEEEEEEGEDGEGEEEADNPVGMSVETDADGQQYVVLEVIQLPGENGEEQQLTVIGPPSYIDNRLDQPTNIESNYDEDQEEFSRDRKAPPNIKIEQDMETCFGFDEEEEEGDEGWSHGEEQETREGNGEEDGEYLQE